MDILLQEENVEAVITAKPKRSRLLNEKDQTNNTVNHEQLLHAGATKQDGTSAELPKSTSRADTTSHEDSSAPMDVSKLTTFLSVDSEACRRQ